MKKVSMNLSSRSISTIDELSKLIYAPNKTRVVTSALEVAKHIIKEQSQGSKIIIEKEDGSKSILKVIL